MPYAPTPLTGRVEGQATQALEFNPQTFGFAATVSRLRVTVQAPSPAACIVALLKNGVAVATATIAANGQDSGNTDFAAISYGAADVLKFQIQSASDTDPPSALTVLAYWNYAVGSVSGPYYSDPIAQVQAHLRNIGIDTGTNATVTTAQIILRQARTDRWIDGRLRAVYYVPLIAVTRNSDVRYPDPIPEIARKWCAGTLVQDIFTDVQPNQSAAAELLVKQAEAELLTLLNPTYRLEGQRLKPRNPGSDPLTEPLKEVGPNAAMPTTPVVPLQ